MSFCISAASFIRVSRFMIAVLAPRTAMPASQSLRAGSVRSCSGTPMQRRKPRSDRQASPEEAVQQATSAALLSLPRIAASVPCSL